MIELRARPAGTRHLIDADTVDDANKTRFRNGPTAALPSVCGKFPPKGWAATWPLATGQCPTCFPEQYVI